MYVWCNNLSKHVILYTYIKCIPPSRKETLRFCVCTIWQHDQILNVISILIDDVKKKFSGYSRKQDNSLSSLNVFMVKVFVRAHPPIFLYSSKLNL